MKKNLEKPKAVLAHRQGNCVMGMTRKSLAEGSLVVDVSLPDSKIVNILQPVLSNTMTPLNPTSAHALAFEAQEVGHA